jgi:hypothetical protein
VDFKKKCSVCKRVYTTFVPKSKYCSSEGAKKTGKQSLASAVVSGIIYFVFKFGKLKITVTT